MEEVSNEFPISVQGFTHAARGVDRGRDVAGSGRVLIGFGRGSGTDSDNNARDGCNACCDGNADYGCNACCGGNAYTYAGTADHDANAGC